MFMAKLFKYPHVQAIHVYCDGSVNGSRSGCGLFIRDYISASYYTNTEVSRRLLAHSACLVCSSIHLPMDCDLVNKYLDLTVHFTWIPSHVGILLNEKADRSKCLSRRHSGPWH
ncbi:hypothetical protein E2C01_033621 [Portunus trituberculatus]|uniref:RNase H type-1 domain-containing protein n=1 Tax=Portunus trituberculatus TaxID=210409 RepID=A0A5B7F4K7_PORTR|nr:hypothetical protein [Portunus trituberculatus]